MKGLGNYRSSERRIGTLLSVQGNRADARFLDGQVFAMPLAPFSMAGVRPGERFVLVTSYEGKRVVDVKVERNEARLGSVLSAPLPKVQVRDGAKLTTRR